MVTLFVVFAATGLLMIGLAIPLLRRRVAPNALYGLRVPATFASEWVWYEANARSARDLAIFGAGGIVLAAVLLLGDLDIETYTWINVAYMLAGALSCGYVGWRRANRLLAQERAEG